MPSVSGSVLRVSKRIVFSYVLDWLAVIAIAAVGGGINSLSGNRRPFSLTDPTISYPYTKEKVSTAVLAIVSLVAPAAIIFIVCAIWVPGPTVPKKTPISLVLRRKFWEWNTGWLGLGLSLAVTFLVTNGTKNMFGKPRPDLLARCDPDVSNADQFHVGFGTALVSWTICRQTDNSILADGFRSFPSGHASFSSAGLTYLTLWLCAKFAIAIPFLSPISSKKISGLGAAFPERMHASSGEKTAASEGGSLSAESFPLRNRAASPPTYLLVLVLVPISTAVYIASTRYSDFRHQGFDILFGSIMGAVFAWFGFRWTHLPIRQGAGWSWGARSRDRAFGIGVGVMGYVGEEGWESASALKHSVHDSASNRTPEGPNGLTGPGHQDQMEGSGMGTQTV